MLKGDFATDFFPHYNVTLNTWQYYVTAYVDVAVTAFQNIDCFAACQSIACDFFVMENTRCFLGSLNETGGTLTGSINPSNWTIYMRAGTRLGPVGRSDTNQAKITSCLNCTHLWNSYL